MGVGEGGKLEWREAWGGGWGWGVGVGVEV